jgi:hypothetical protein
MSKFDETIINLPRYEHGSRDDHNSPSCRSSIDGHSTRKSPLEDPNATGKMERGISLKDTACCGFAGVLCIMFNKEDCRRIEESELEPNNEDEALFCTLCNAEVAYGLSKNFVLCSVSASWHRLYLCCSFQLLVYLHCVV